MGGMFGRFWKWIVPLIARNDVPYIKKHLKQDLLYCRKRGFGQCSYYSSRLVGREIEETLKENTNSAIKNFKVKAENALKKKDLKRSIKEDL